MAAGGYQTAGFKVATIYNKESIVLDIPAARLYVGGHASYIQGEREDLAGERMFTAAHPPPGGPRPTTIQGILDSGAFTDRRQRRLTPDQALERQLRWEQRAIEKWEFPWQAHALVSYDLLIDETWIQGQREQRRWSVQATEVAVQETILAAHFLASQRERLSPRILVLTAQGVDALQYAECSAEVLRVAQSVDWFGFGGWCPLGRRTTLLPEFWRTLRLVLPMVAKAGVRHVHIFGVLYLPALGGLVYLADQHGLSVSTDSTAPILACTRRDKKRAGVRAEYWRDNVQWWKASLSSLRTSCHYRQPTHQPTERHQDLNLWG